jgi:hypothetical protein
MSAKEMFEKLGYRFEKPTDMCGNEVEFCYRYVKFDGTWLEELNFNDSTKLLHTTKRLNNMLWNYIDFMFTFELLQAIQQQIKELGWE